MSKNNNHEVAIVGGGPAGMMAAIVAKNRGVDVVLIEKNRRLGEKLSITGGGRCNITNNKPVVRDILSEYKEAGKFLFSTFMQYSVTDTVRFFAELDMLFKEENEGRLFPVTESAPSVRDLLEKTLLDVQVPIITNAPVVNITKHDEQFVITCQNGEVISARKLVLATGGSARPETGSSGDAWPWLEKLGHKINAVDTALVPIVTKESWSHQLSGVSLSDAKVTLYCGGQKRDSKKGKILFTHTGLSGPLILNMSKKISECLTEDKTTLKIDLLPTYDDGVLQKQLQAMCAEQPNKKIKNILTELLPLNLVQATLSFVEVDGEKPARDITAVTRKRIGVALKAIIITPTGLLGSDKAVISSGGVDITDVDFRTMESKIVSGLYLIGDVLDINRPSGGYSLQLCWSTGAVAGVHV